MTNHELAKKIVDGILDTVERTGRITKADGLTLGSVLDAGTIVPVYDRLVVWTAMQLDAREPEKGTT